MARCTQPKIVVFSADWCPHCHRMIPVLEEVAKRYEGRVTLFIVNVTRSPKTAAKYAVRGVPTMLFFKKGTPCAQLVGEEPLQIIEEKIKTIL